MLVQVLWHWYCPKFAITTGQLAPHVGAGGWTLGGEAGVAGVVGEVGEPEPWNSTERGRSLRPPVAKGLRAASSSLPNLSKPCGPAHPVSAHSVSLARSAHRVSCPGRMHACRESCLVQVAQLLAGVIHHACCSFLHLSPAACAWDTGGRADHGSLP